MGKEGKKASATSKKKSTSASTNKSADKRADAGLKQAQSQTQWGVSTMFENMKKATEAIENLAPGIGPKSVSEDDVNLEVFSDSAQ